MTQTEAQKRQDQLVNSWADRCRRQSNARHRRITGLNRRSGRKANLRWIKRNLLRP